MAVPKKRRPKPRTKTAHSINFRASAKNTGICKNCSAPVLPHMICPVCGFYKGRKVKTTKIEKQSARKARQAEEKK